MTMQSLGHFRSDKKSSIQLNEIQPVKGNLDLHQFHDDLKNFYQKFIGNKIVGSLQNESLHKNVHRFFRGFFNVISLSVNDVDIKDRFDSLISALQRVIGYAPDIVVLNSSDIELIDKISNNRQQEAGKNYSQKELQDIFSAINFLYQSLKEDSIFNDLLCILRHHGGIVKANLDSLVLSSSATENVTYALRVRS